MNRKGLYAFVFTLLLGSVQIKYKEPETNPFLSTPAMPLFVASITCHVLASMAGTNLQAPLIIFHLSGIVGCEVLIWVLLADIFWYSMVNMFASIVAFICFFNHILNIFADHEMPVIEMQPPEEEYLVLVALELTCIGIKYEVSNTNNPFQQSSLLFFLTAIFSNVLASTTDTTKQITIITFQVSGITGVETLLWILIPDFMCYCMVNLLLLLLALFFFNHVAQLVVYFFKYISQLLLQVSGSNVDQMSNLELQPQEDRV
uniref:Uncharacterized protein n=1 Tax=Glycine max TaxID=3847 RepID=K7MQD6_SOYBN